jgi:hypothetical protein
MILIGKAGKELQDKMKITGKVENLYELASSMSGLALRCAV